MLNISQIPNKLYLAECFVQTSGDSMNQGIGTSVPENWRKRGGGGHMMFLIRGSGDPLNEGLTPWRIPCRSISFINIG